MNNPNRLWRFAYYWLPLIAWAGMIFALSHTDGSTLNTTIDETSQFLPIEVLTEEFTHLVQFGMLAALAYRLLISYPTLPRRWTLGGALAFTIAYAALDEFHQMFVPGRYATLYDLALDTVGAVIGLGLAVIIFGLVRRIWGLRSI